MILLGMLMWIWVQKKSEFFGNYKGAVIPSLIDPSDYFLYDKFRLDHWKEWSECKSCMKNSQK